ncbi:hypothetical protein YC2023_033539 [Brassica napus]
MLRMRRKIKKTWRIKEQNETRNVGFVGRHESYAHRSKQTHIERSSNNISDVLEHNVHQSSGRKIASKIVTPARDDQENNYNREEVAHVPVQRDVGMIHPSRHNALFKKRFETIKTFYFGTD